MTWAKLDDNFPDHPKVRALGVFGLGLQAASICYCSRYLTDGLLTFSVADQLIASVMAQFTLPDGRLVTPLVTSGNGTELASDWHWPSRMVRAGLWDKTRKGYLVHDYLTYNPTRASVIAERAKAAERQAKHRGQPPPDGHAVTSPEVFLPRPLSTKAKTKTSTAFDLKGEGSSGRTGSTPTKVGRLLPRLTPEQDAARLAALQAKP